nr:hypothetical protein [Candidatus Dadabacteria bacterium]NIQ14143.1 hypothetical protein [Candidatus Dadabacteria bacterium]
QQTLIIVGSDHGLTPTHSHFDSLYYLENKGYKPLYYTNIFKHFFNADTSVMVSGNSMAHYYFKNGGKWETNTYRNDIPQLIDELADRPEIDIVCAREEEGKIYVRGDNGDANIWFDGEGMINYRSISGDIFGYGLKTIKMLLNEGISNSIKTEYPDAIVQILQLFESPRTGDVVLSAKPGFDLRATHEKPEHCGSHGSLRKEHMMVPILINEKVEKDHARTVDIFPTIIKHLGSNIPEDIDGESLIS